MNMDWIWEWIIASGCESHSCVEVSLGGEAGARVRDTEDRAGGHVEFTPDQWRNFIDALPELTKDQ